MQERIKRCRSLSLGEEVRHLPFPLSPGAHQSRDEAVHNLGSWKTSQSQPVHEAAVDVWSRCHQVVVIAWSSLLRDKQCVCAERVCKISENDFPRGRGRWASTQEPSTSDKDVPRFGWHVGTRGRKAWPEESQENQGKKI